MVKLMRELHLSLKRHVALGVEGRVPGVQFPLVIKTVDVDYMPAIAEEFGLKVNSSEPSTRHRNATVFYVEVLGNGQATTSRDSARY